MQIKGLNIDWGCTVLRRLALRRSSRRETTNEYVASSPAVTCAAPASVIEFVAPSPAVADVQRLPQRANTWRPQLPMPYAAPDPVFQICGFITPAVSYAAPAPLTRYVASEPAVTFTASAPVIEHVDPSPAGISAAPVTEHASSSLAAVCAAPDTVIEHVAAVGTCAAPGPVTECAPAAAYAVPDTVIEYGASPPAGTCATPMQCLLQ